MDVEVGGAEEVDEEEEAEVVKMVRAVKMVRLKPSLQINKIIQQQIQDGEHHDILTYLLLACASAIGSLASPVLCVWNLKHVPGNNISSQDPRIEVLTSSMKKNPLTKTFTVYCMKTMLMRK